MFPRTTLHAQMIAQATQTNALLAAARKSAQPCSEPCCPRVTTDVYVISEFGQPRRIVCVPCFEAITSRETRAMPRDRNHDIWDE